MRHGCDCLGSDGLHTRRGGSSRAGGEQIATGQRGKLVSVIGAIIAGARAFLLPYRCMSHEYLERILKARVYDVAIESPLEEAPRLSRRLGNAVLFKREDLQPVFSFKVRGAYNKIAHLSETIAKRGVICASAGNHAQGVALAAKRRGIPATIVMPQTTPRIKVQAVIDLGGEVVLHGDEYDEAYEHALTIARERHLTFIHPFDDPDVIAGQGTIGMEILRQQPGETLDAIFVAVGGGGLIAGVGGLREVPVSEDPRDRRRAGRCGRDVPLAAGRQARHAGSGRHLRRRRRRAAGRRGAVPAGAASTSTRSSPSARTRSARRSRTSSKTTARSSSRPARCRSPASSATSRASSAATAAFVAINCGANMNFDRLRHVAERADIGGQREALVAVEIPERKGSFLQFCEMLGKRNVTEFNYRYHDDAAPRSSSSAWAWRKAARKRRRCSLRCATPATRSST